MDLTSSKNQELTLKFWRIILGIDVFDKFIGYYDEEIPPESIIEAGNEWKKLNDIEGISSTFFTKENFKRIYHKFLNCKTKEETAFQIKSESEECKLFLTHEFSYLTYYNDTIYFPLNGFSKFLNFVLLKSTTQSRFDRGLIENQPRGQLALGMAIYEDFIISVNENKPEIDASKANDCTSYFCLSL